MKLNLIRGQEAAACAAIGAGGAAIFLFAFPKGSITTLMHEVLDLPGPGAGIALVLGPLLVLVALLCLLLSRGEGGALIASLAFAGIYAMLAWLFGVSTNPKGAFGSPAFIASACALGIAVEVVMVFGRGLKQVWCCMLSGALANAVLLVFYWIAVFPRTAGWVRWSDVPVLMALCLVCGLVSGCMAWGLSRPLSKTLVSKEKE